MVVLLRGAYLTHPSASKMPPLAIAMCLDIKARQQASRTPRKTCCPSAVARLVLDHTTQALRWMSWSRVPSCWKWLRSLTYRLGSVYTMVLHGSLAAFLSQPHTAARLLRRSAEKHSRVDLSFAESQMQPYISAHAVSPASRRGTRGT